MSGITDFSKARVGDKVFDRFRQEWGYIASINKEMDYSINVLFKKDSENYMIDGKLLKEHTLPALVWNIFDIYEFNKNLPEMPKRMVKKKIEGWVNVYHSDNSCGHILKFGSLYAYETKEEAKNFQNSHTLGEPLFISHEYEVEEN